MYHWRAVMGISRQLLLAIGLLLGATRLLSDAPLGPVEGIALPAKDLDRIKIGELAPDFRLSTHTGDVYRLSDQRGVGDVVLVFYRGHW